MSPEKDPKPQMKTQPSQQLDFSLVRPYQENLPGHA